MSNVKVIEKIKKLFELSKNNPSEEEARSAALKAQELLVQHNIDIAEVEDCSLDKIEKIGEVEVDLEAKKWKYELATIVSKNFRCKHFYHGKDQLVFYGHETDATVAAETFKYLFNAGNRLGNKLAREARKEYGYADNVYNSCVVGFCQGIRQALAEQSSALMVVVPEDVKDGFEDLSKNFRNMRLSRVKAYHRGAFEAGKQQGYDAMRRNRICA